MIGREVKPAHATRASMDAERAEKVLELKGLSVRGKFQPATLDFRAIFPPLVNNADATQFIADCASELVGSENIDRNGGLTMASEDFAYMLEHRPGAYIQIGNGDGEGACEVHNPAYDFNDEALPFGASLFVKLVEKRLDRLTAS